MLLITQQFKLMPLVLKRNLNFDLLQSLIKAF